MRHIQTEILVIGGGATGTGIVRDLAMRGFKTVLVERRDLADGTTGRYHGLLHSGGRYVVKDPQAAKECIEENRILRRIMPQCIEDTGGFFVLTPHDDPAYADAFLEGCHLAGIPCEPVSPTQLLRQEPLLNPHIRNSWRLPDASADSFLATELNATAAQEYGATILRYHPVIQLRTTSRTPHNTVASHRSVAITGAICHDLIKDEDVEVHADLVINAAGAWVGKITAPAGITIQMIPGKGTLLAIAQRVVNTVINRCKPPGDGDILVPAHTVTVIGTTDIRVTDPDRLAIEPWEVQLMLDEGEKLIPGFRELRFLRAWAGVRPLYHETEGATDSTLHAATDRSPQRDITRAFVLLDHELRDGVPGLLTITGGKWTTYRKMAEVTVDKACEKLSTSRECRTHLEVLPTGAHGGYHYLGTRLAEIEKAQAYGQLVCECELATRQEIEHAIIERDAQSLDDIRRDTRLGMGPCQGGFCTIRASGILHRLKGSPIEEINLALRDFLQERWKGVLPILWGQQLRQERLNELIYLNVLNADHLPGPKEGRLSQVDFTQPEARPERESTGDQEKSSPNLATPILPGSPGFTSPAQDVLVIGAGFSGLTAAWQAAVNGKRVKVITRGWGTTHWASGCVDVLGYGSDPEKSFESPATALVEFLPNHPGHPYALLGLDQVDKALGAFQALCAEAHYPLRGSLERNWWLPTALGTARPTCLAPETMVAGDLQRREPMLIVGFEPFLDFYPALVADNLAAQGISAKAINLNLVSLRRQRLVNGLSLSRLFDNAEFRQEVVQALKPHLGEAGRVGFPAVLGLYQPLEALHHLEECLGRAVFEIPGLPPSIPGMRLHNLLVAAIEKAGGSVLEGMAVSALTISTNSQRAQLSAVFAPTPKGRGKSIETVWSEAAARCTSHTAHFFILATGGFLGGGITMPGHSDDPYETALGLPILIQENLPRFQPKFLALQGHPIYHTGVQVNSDLQPVDENGLVIYENLYAVGGTLANCDPVRERSLEGIAIATGYTAGQMV